MGLNIWMKSPNTEVDEAFSKHTLTALNRSFNSFANGYEGIGPNCEFHQIQELSGIDLSPFRMFNLAPYNEYYVEYRLESAITEEEKQQFRQEEQDELENNWVHIDKLEHTINALRAVFKEDDVLDKVDYKVLTKSYFKFGAKNIRYNIEEDFQLIIKFIQHLRANGISKIAFYIA